MCHTTCTNYDMVAMAISRFSKISVFWPFLQILKGYSLTRHSLRQVITLCTFIIFKIADCVITDGAFTKKQISTNLWLFFFSTFLEKKI
jgi:hypothetical protein